MSTSITGPWTPQHESLRSEAKEKEKHTFSVMRILCGERVYEEALDSLLALEDFYSLSTSFVDRMFNFIVKQSAS